MGPFGLRPLGVTLNQVLKVFFVFSDDWVGSFVHQIRL